MRHSRRIHHILLAAAASATAAALPAQTKFGFVDISGNVVIDPTFDEAGAFREGVAVVKVGERYGVIDRTGRYVLKPEFEHILDGPPTARLLVHACETCAWTLRDSAGTVTRLTSYRGHLFGYSDGLIRGHDVFLDDTLGVVLEIDGGRYQIQHDFSEGLVSAVEYKTGKEGYLDKQGRVAIPFKFSEDVNPFVNGYAVIEKVYDKGLIDRTGRVILKPEWRRITPFEGGVAFVSGKDGVAIVDTTGRVRRRIGGHSLHAYAHGAAIIQSSGNDGTYRLVDRTGKVLFESSTRIREILDDSTIVTDAAGPRRDAAIRRFDGRVIEDGVELPVFADLGEFSEGLAPFRGMSTAARIAASGAILDAKTPAELAREKAVRDSIAAAEAARARAAERAGPPPGTVRYIWYDVRRSMRSQVQRVKIGANYMMVRTYTWYVDHGQYDGPPGMAAGQVAALFTPRHHALTVPAGSGVFVLESGMGVSEEAMKRVGVKRGEGDFVHETVVKPERP